MTEDERPLDPVRLQKMEALAASGVDPYGGRFDRTALAGDVVRAFDGYEGREVRVAGRIRAIRGHGRMTFCDLEDRTGSVQVQFTEDTLGGETYGRLAHLDLGDIIGVEGLVFRTRRGEPTVGAAGFVVLSKALRPVPSRFYGLKDTDLRYRQRYLDLIANPEVRRTFTARSRMITRIRTFLDRRAFVEVETPILIPVVGGATARPFRTYHNAAGLDLSLRISIELYLKRLMVGGIERVYEIGRVFRNEGVDTRHNPEFTLLELYQAYGDLRDIMELVESMVYELAVDMTGASVVPYQGTPIDYTPPWPRVSMIEALARTTGIDWLALPDGDEAARDAARSVGLEFDAGASRGHILDKLVGQFVEPTLVQPTFLIDHPVEISPLAKARPDLPRVADRFEAFVAGREIANAFSELNDPLEQRRRFNAQVEERRRTADEEIPDPDEDFLLSLEYGMPPAGGLGIGIDRLVMLLTDAPSLRDVLLFPLTRPVGEGDGDGDAGAGGPDGEGR